MDVLTMSILGAVMAALIIAFFWSLLTAEKVDLAGRIERERVAEMADVENTSRISETGYGRMYKTIIRKRVGASGIQKIATFLGVDMWTLQESVELAGLAEKTSAEELVSMKFLGICGAVLFGGVGLASRDLLYAAAAAVSFFAGFVLPQDKIKAALKKRSSDILNELPGFIERTYMCMESGANLKQALGTVAETSGGVLGQEFMRAFALAGYGTGWEKELELMAARIQVEALQDFVVDVIMANAKGISVIDTLEEEAEHINSIRRSQAMMAVGALETRVMLLVMVFSLVPTMGVLLLPVLINSLAIL